MRRYIIPCTEVQQTVPLKILLASGIRSNDHGGNQTGARAPKRI